MFENLFETLDSKLEIKRNTDLEHKFNSQLGDSVYPGHTAAFHTDHMTKNDLSVLRVMTKHPMIEYHLVSLKHAPGETTATHDNKSILHAMNIISKDAKFHLDRGRSVSINSPTEDLHHVYQKFAKHLLKKNNMEHKTIKSKGESNGIYSTIIESPINEEKMNLHKTILEIINKNKP